jgi:hypothetical protein
MEDWDLLRQLQEIDFNTSEYEDLCKKMNVPKEVPKEDRTEEPKKDEPLPTLAELRQLRLAKFSPSSGPSR